MEMGLQNALKFNTAFAHPIHDAISTFRADFSRDTVEVEHRIYDGCGLAPFCRLADTKKYLYLHEKRIQSHRSSGYP